ncbi:hypothetical protein [Labilibaculum sp. K2S]|uniref:hypothetical protein n=1 Tax=Labilibaculum sp. K2S TaxID=3056386 RepID=UPI0025A3F306|nr:hypothetical protein [Labilibaculum sp. K2S]
MEQIEFLKLRCVKGRYVKLLVLCFVKCLKEIASNLEYTNKTVGAIREETVASYRGSALKEIEFHFPFSIRSCIEFETNSNCSILLNHILKCRKLQGLIEYLFVFYLLRGALLPKK